MNMISNSSRIESQTISWLRFPLVLCVVFAHNSQLTQPHYPSLIEGVMDVQVVADYFRIWISWILTSVAVPCFFVISGFLFFNKTPELTLPIYRDKMRKRFHTLVIPYLLWNLIPLLIIFLSRGKSVLFSGESLVSYLHFCRDYLAGHGWLDIFWGCNVYGGYIHGWLGNEVWYTSPFNYPLWYIRNLIVVCFFSPLIYWAIKTFGKWMLVPMVILYFGNIDVLIPGLDAMTLLYFGIGSYFAINRKNIVSAFREVKSPCCIIAFVAMIFATVFQGGHTEIGYYFYCIYMLAGVVSVFNIASALVQVRKVRIHPILTASVFFIFAFHTDMIVEMYTVLLNKMFVIAGLNPVNLFTYLTTPFVKTAICVVVYYLLMRWFPRIGKVLTGGR